MCAVSQVQTRPRTRGVQQRQVRPQQQGQGIVDPALPHIRLLPPSQPAGAAPTNAGGLWQMTAFAGDLKAILSWVFFSGIQLQVGCQNLFQGEHHRLFAWMHSMMLVAIRPAGCTRVAAQPFGYSKCSPLLNLMLRA